MKEVPMEVVNIWAYVANKNMTMGDLCRQLECTPSHFSRIINGKGHASPQLAKRAYEKTDGFLKLPWKEKKRHKNMSEDDFWVA
jgi:hypothetical protein